MTDQERELPPEQEAAVRRLLADARATDPLPEDVAARLGRVIAGLGEERAPGAPLGHDLAPPWRRRRATALLVAAAAVVALGVGLGQIDGGNDTGGGDVDAAVNAERAPSALAEDSDSSEAPTPSVQPPTVQGSAPETSGPVGRVRAGHFTADVNQLRRAIPDDAPDGEFVRLPRAQLPKDYVVSGRTFECPPAPWGPGVLVPVYFDGTPAVLAYRPVTGESQIVELLRCGTGESLRSTTLRAG